MALVLVLLARALAQDDPQEAVSVSLSDDFELRYYVAPASLVPPPDVPLHAFDYVEQVNRLNASVGVDRWTLEAQVDEVVLFNNQYRLDGVVVPERDLLGEPMFAPFAIDRAPQRIDTFGYATLEKVRARYETDATSLTFGDAYAAFGRGIALNLNRNVDIDIDTSIQGFKGVFRPGAWDVTVVAGQLNRQQVFQDNPNVTLLGDRRHAVAALRVERFGLGPANLGAHGVVYEFVDDNGWVAAGDAVGGVEELGSPLDVAIGGVTAELTGVGGVDWYVEGDVFGYDPAEVPNPLVQAGGTGQEPGDLGYAGYLSAAFYPGKTTWLVEVKRYYQAERVNALLGAEMYEVAVAPTLEYERAINEDTSSAMNSNDITGGRVRVDWAVAQGVIPYASIAVSRDDDLALPHFNRTAETIVHPVGGLEWIADDSALLANVGYRVDRRDPNPVVADDWCLEPPCGADVDTQVWSDLALKFPLVAGLHGELQGDLEIWSWGANAFQQSDFVEATSGVTVQKGSDLAITLYNDFTNNPLVVSTGNWPVEVGDDGERPLYGAVEVQVKPTTALTVKAFYGAYKAGIRCAGGQCRQLPGFEGGRLGVQGAF